MRALLTYHAIDTSGSVISVTPECFARHVAWLASGAVRVVGLDELLALPDDIDAVALTFDDALTSVATEAAPRLAAHGLPATLFVVSDHVGGDNRWSGVTSPGIPVAPVLDWEALARLQEGGWTIGAHSRRHPHLTACSDDQLDDELAGAAQQLHERLGARPTSFAYPYGTADARVIAAAARHYRLAVGTEHRPLGTHDDAHHLPRLDAWYFRGPVPFRDWGTPRFRRRIAARHALRRLRRMLP